MNIFVVLEMKFTLISLFLMLLAITYGVFDNSTNLNKNYLAKRSSNGLNTLNTMNILKDSASYCFQC
jgi:hypothetical protein